MEEQHQGMDSPVAVVAVVHRRRQKSMGNHHSIRVCCSTPITPGRHENLVSYIENHEALKPLRINYSLPNIELKYDC